MKIVKIKVGQLEANCYLAINEITRKCLIIDPGDEADYIERIILDEDAKPVAIIATHGHFDHIMAVEELKLAYGVPFLLHEKDRFLISRMKSSAKHFTGVNLVLNPPTIDTKLMTGDLKIENFDLKIIHTPGHTPGSCSLYFPNESCVFVGDLVFAGGYVGRTDFKYSNKKDLNDSIKNLLKIPEGTLLYTGHGETTSIRELKNYFRN